MIWDNPQVLAGLIAAGTALVTTLLTLTLGNWFTALRERGTLRHKLQLEYEYEVRKSLKQLVGNFKSPLLDAAYELSRRLWNFYENVEQAWLDIPHSENPGNHYYFGTFAYRILRFFAWSSILQDRVMFIDRSICGEEEIDFLTSLQLAEATLCDVRLFEGLGYDSNYQRDHIFADNLALMAARLTKTAGGQTRVLTYNEFSQEIQKDSDFKASLTAIFEILRGLKNKTDDGRYRWDRLVFLHYSLARLLSRYGYEYHRLEERSFDNILRHLVHPEIARNFLALLTELKMKPTKYEIESLLSKNAT